MKLHLILCLLGFHIWRDTPPVMVYGERESHRECDCCGIRQKYIETTEFCIGHYMNLRRPVK